MDKVKKVYIDSRYKSNDSVSNSDFKFDLKEGLDLPDNTVCYIDDISIPHTWYTIEENLNNIVYRYYYNGSWRHTDMVSPISTRNTSWKLYRQFPSSCTAN